jgi:hypothetical protein
MICEQYMEKKELEEFENNIFPFLQRTHDMVEEAEKAAREYYGIEEEKAEE